VMVYLLLVSVLSEFKQCLEIYIFSDFQFQFQPKKIGTGTNGSAAYILFGPTSLRHVNSIDVMNISSVSYKYYGNSEADHHSRPLLCSRLVTILKFIYASV
jgi:hypothetical protein